MEGLYLTSFGSGELISRRVVEIIGEMKQLEHLAIHSSYIKNDHLIDLLKTTGFGRQLESLELRVKSLELFDQVLTECPNLVHLAIEFEDSFEGPFTPAVGLKKLRYLKLGDEVTPGMLTAITASTDSLEFVDISETTSSRRGPISMELRRLIRDCPTLNHVHIHSTEGYTMIRLAMDLRVRAQRVSGKWPLSTLQLCLDKIPSHLPQHPHIYIAEWEPKHNEQGKKKVDDKKCRMPELNSIRYGKGLSGGIPTFLTSRDCACGFC